MKADASQLLKRMQNDDATALVLTQNGRASTMVQNYDNYQHMQQSQTMMKLVAMSEANIASGSGGLREEISAEARTRRVARLTSDD